MMGILDNEEVNKRNEKILMISPTTVNTTVQIKRELEIEREQVSKMRNEKGKLIMCAVGIFVCYFVYGILQEKITKGTYTLPDGTREKFIFTMSLVFVQCIINGLFARTAIQLVETERDSTPTKLYMVCSISYLGAMLASNHSLQHVAYPTQVLGKSVKPIPVMILGVLVAKKRYPLAKYLCVLMIVSGVALFMYKDSNGKRGKSAEEPLIGMGEFLLMVSLTLDGLTGAFQDTMRGSYQTKAWRLMFNINLWSQLWLAIGLVVSGELFTFVYFVQRHPSVIFNILSFGLASALGQTFIFITVTSFGPLTCSIMTTTRKFFTILGSVLIFGNPMFVRQWIGTVLVFIGLGLDSKYGKEKKQIKS